MQNALEAASSHDLRIVRMHEELDGDHIIVSVSDNGEGILEQTRSKIFTPNFTTKSSGTGLGLAMSKGIVEQARERSGSAQLKAKRNCVLCKAACVRELPIDLFLCRAFVA